MSWTERATRHQWADSIQVGMLNKSVIRILGGMEQDRMSFHHATQNDTQFKTYQFFLELTI
jgi:hypothetical protein